MSREAHTSELVNAAGQCNACRHRVPFTAKCRAFPNGIPDEIIFGRHDHQYPFPGDHGIHWEPKDEVDEEE